MLLLVTFDTAISAENAPLPASQLMKFEARPPNPALAFVLGTTWTIFASGPIDGDAATRLRAMLKEKNVPLRSTIYLDSPGGNLLAGMELGRVIRDYELRADVGQVRPDTDLGQAVGPGVCFSACTLAYLGGTFRFLMTGSRYGVHRFYFGSPTPDASDLAQMASAAIIQYLRDMDVDTRLFTASTRAGEHEIFELSRSELIELNVVNNGVTRPRWTIESNRAGMYVRGERDTTFGINKFMLICDAKKIVLYIIFDPQNREKEVLNFTADYLYINGANTRIDQARIERKVVNGWINAFYMLSRQQVEAIARAETVGVAMLPTPSSPIFLGFDAMPVGRDGNEKIQGFVAACR
ncbi:hypothetical protein [Bradyrhizobium sp. SZCCHNR1015]|uniref:COG3904 family protein n=1 Tax=Bradyrhizobium sp. SZCCHNR1015 TaxID=3057338 RepID=UPI002915D643|nr:hypothetical protein [Bradyrhizobium sp. SZCCHNR1015]